MREGDRDVTVEDQAGLLLSMERLYQTLQQAAAHNIEVRTQVMNVATRVFRGFTNARASLALASSVPLSAPVAPAEAAPLNLSLADELAHEPADLTPQSKGFTLSLVPVTSKEADADATLSSQQQPPMPQPSTGATTANDDPNLLPTLNFSNIPQGGGAGTTHVAQGQVQTLVQLYESAPMWRARDISSKGFGFSVGTNEARIPPQLGELLGLLPPTVKYPLLGVVVRKINDPQTNEITLGVEILSPRPLPVVVHRVPAINIEMYPDGNNRTGEEVSPQAPVANETMTIPAIFAPGVEFDGRLDTLVLPANKFSTADNYIIESGGNKFRIVVNRVVRKSDDWVALRFEVREQI